MCKANTHNPTWLLLLWALYPGAVLAAEPAQYSAVLAASTLKLGDTFSEMSLKLQSTWIPVTSNSFAGIYPFCKMLPHLNHSQMCEWRSKELVTGWPLIIFATFDTPAKTNLVDALLFNGIDSLQPLVFGACNRHLLAVKKGDRIQDIYRMLGRRSCDYNEGNGGKFYAEFHYFANDGQIIRIRVDGATGRVVDVAKLGL